MREMAGEGSPSVEHAARCGTLRGLGTRNAQAAWVLMEASSRRKGKRGRSLVCTNILSGSNQSAHHGAEQRSLRMSRQAVSLAWSRRTEGSAMGCGLAAINAMIR